MKAVSIFFVSVALVSVAVTAFSDFGLNLNNNEYAKEIGMKAWEAADKVLRGDDIGTMRGPAINWTWESWGLGPACHDYSKYSLIDFDETTLNFVRNKLDSALEAAVAEVTSRNLKIGAGLGVSYNGQVIHMISKGVKNMSTSEEPDANTIFQIGSVTKMFTSMMMNALADRGVLDINDPVTKYYNEQYPPVFQPFNPYDNVVGASAVTLESLASHTSGLPHDTPCMYSPQCTEDAIVNRANYYPLFHAPLIRPHYSNYGFALLGQTCVRAACRKTGSEVTYEKWIEDNILTPFNMTKSGFEFTDEVIAQMARSYSITETGTQEPNPYFATSLGWTNPAGGMYSTLADMMKFLTHLLAKEGVMSANAYEQYFLAGAPLADGVSSFGKSGWEVAYANGFRTITKSGSIAGFSTTIAFIPELKFGMFTWTNHDDGLFPSRLSASVMNMFVPLIKNEMVKNQPKHEIPSVADKLVGSYTNKNGTVAFEFKRTKDTATTGLFTGVLSSSEVTFEYDARTTAAVNKTNTLFFRYHIVPAVSCFAEAQLGVDNGLAIFRLSETTGKWQVSVPDVILVNLTHVDEPEPSSSSSTKPSTTSSTSPSSSHTKPSTTSSVIPAGSSSKKSSSPSSAAVLLPSILVFLIFVVLII